MKCCSGLATVMSSLKQSLPDGEDQALRSDDGRGASPRREGVAGSTGSIVVALSEVEVAQRELCAGAGEGE